MVEPFFDMNMYIQVNGESFLDRRYKRTLKKLIKKGKVHLIGSDMHNLETRVTRMDEAEKKIIKKYGLDFLGEISNNGRKIIKR